VTAAGGVVTAAVNTAGTAAQRMLHRSSGRLQESVRDDASSEDLSPSSTSGKTGSRPCFVFLGWDNTLGETLQVLDKLLTEATEVHVLSEAPPHEREAALKRWHFRRVQLVHHVGERLSVHELARLPLGRAAAVLVLSEGVRRGGSADGSRAAGGAHEDAITSDSACLACVQMVTALLRGCYGHRVEAVNGLPRILCEVLDPRTDRVLARNRTLRQQAVFFRSCALQMGLFTIAAADPTSFNALVLLLAHSAGGEGNAQGARKAELVAVPVGQYVDASELAEADCPRPSGTRARFGPPSIPKLMSGISSAEAPESIDGPGLSFWDLHERVRSSDGGILVGWMREDLTATPGAQAGPARLVPDVDRRQRHAWSEEHVLLVLSLRQQQQQSRPPSAESICSTTNA